MPGVRSPTQPPPDPSVVSSIVPDLKLVCVGQHGTGKSCWLHRMAKGEFNQHTKATIGVDFHSFNLQVADDLCPPHKQVCAKVWDVQGQNHSISLTSQYYRGALGGMVFCEVDSRESFDETLRWKRDIDQKLQSGLDKTAPILLVVNKIDLRDASDASQNWCNPQQLDQFCEEHGFIGWRLTSAKTGKGVEDALRTVVEKVVVTFPACLAPSVGVKSIGLPPKVKNKKSTTCCN